MLLPTAVTVKFEQRIPLCGYFFLFFFFFESHYYLFQFKCLRSTLSAFLSCAFTFVFHPNTLTLTCTFAGSETLVYGFGVGIYYPRYCGFFYYFYLLYDCFYVRSTLGYRCNMNYRARIGAFETKTKHTRCFGCWTLRFAKHNSALFPCSFHQIAQFDITNWENSAIEWNREKEGNRKPF